MLKPMLASPAPAKITFPVYASPKLDGIRAIVKNGVLLSRSLKVIPNDYVQDKLGVGGLDGLDGELVVGPPNHNNAMQATTSGIMSRDGKPDFIYWVFDYWTEPDIPYDARYRLLSKGINSTFRARHPQVRLLPHEILTNESQLVEYETFAVNQGFEGVMIRKHDGLYKYGRSTAREGYLLKIKRFEDSEAVVIGFEERMHNENEATINALGYQERSSHKDNLVPMDTLGSLVVKDVKSGIEFGIGTGFDDHTRSQIWQNRQRYLGRIVTYKHFANAGVKVAPRFPVFKAFRGEWDL